MKIIASGRQTGKTTKLIQMSAETGAYIVARSHTHVDYIVATAKQMKLKIPFPLTFWELRYEKYYGKGIEGFLIDDVDGFLRYSISCPIVAITLTTEEDSD